jgi:hypothetical protein
VGSSVNRITRPRSDTLKSKKIRPRLQTGPEVGILTTTIIAESTQPVDKKLRFGRLVRSPIVAWAFDVAAAKLTPVPVAAGAYGLFVDNKPSNSWKFVPASPGSYQVSYIVDPEHRRSFSSRDPDLKRSAGALLLGLQVAGHDDDADAEGCGKSWLDLATEYEDENSDL